MNNLTVLGKGNKLTVCLSWNVKLDAFLLHDCESWQKFPGIEQSVECSEKTNHVYKNTGRKNLK